MTRRATGVDRTITFLSGVGLIVLGGLVIAWVRGAVGEGGAVHVLGSGLLDAPWWPWASGGAGLLLVALGLRWLATHRRPHKAFRVSLDGSGPDLTANAASVAAAAATALGAEPSVVKATGAAIIERSTPTVVLTATVSARHGLRSGIEAADEVARTVAVMLGDGVAVRTVLRVDADKGIALR